MALDIKALIRMARNMEKGLFFSLTEASTLASSVTMKSKELGSMNGLTASFMKESGRKIK